MFRNTMTVTLHICSSSCSIFSGKNMTLLLNNSCTLNFQRTLFRYFFAGETVQKIGDSASPCFDLNFSCINTVCFILSYSVLAALTNFLHPAGRLFLSMPTQSKM